VFNAVLLLLDANVFLLLLLLEAVLLLLNANVFLLLLLDTVLLLSLYLDKIRGLCLLIPGLIQGLCLLIPGLIQGLLQDQHIQGENLRNPVLDIELGETLRSIEERGYHTPTYNGSPLNSPRETIQALPGTIQAVRSSPPETPPRGGKYSKNVYKKVGKKEVLGKDRVIYKMKGSNKEYLKSKGMYIPVSEYKKLKKIK
jgi:hypothetical protein